MNDLVGNWGVCVNDFSQATLDVWNNYPFKGFWHKCVGVGEDGYLLVQFSCIILEILPSGFVLVNPPDFEPFDRVKYVSSKKKLEFGTVVGFGVLNRPFKRRVYQLNVKGKVKSTLYEMERLTLIEETPDIFANRQKLSKLISHALRHEPGKYNLELDSEGWVKMEDLINALKEKGSEWNSLQYFDILKMIDKCNKKRHEVKAKRVGPEYKNNYEWYIRAKYGHPLMEKFIKSV